MNSFIEAVAYIAIMLLYSMNGALFAEFAIDEFKKKHHFRFGFYLMIVITQIACIFNAAFNF